MNKIELTEQEKEALYTKKYRNPDTPDGYQDFQILRKLYQRITGKEASTCTCVYKSLIQKLKKLC